MFMTQSLTLSSKNVASSILHSAFNCCASAVRGGDGKAAGLHGTQTPS